MISLATLVQFVFFLIIAGLIVWILLWLIGAVGLPDPFAKVARIAIYVASAFILIWSLMGLIGQSPPLFRP